MREPIIEVNGQLLDEGQAMTIRVAIESFAISLDRDGLGDDAHGKAMCKLYLESINSIHCIIINNA